MQVTAWWLVGLMDQLDDIDPLNGYDPAIGPPPSGRAIAAAVDTRLEWPDEPATTRPPP